MAGQESFDNNVLLEEQRIKLNFNALDTVSQSATTTQDLASSVNFASGKGWSIDGGDVCDDYDPGTYTVTAVPVTSGTITLSDDTLSFLKIGGGVFVSGMIRVGSVSSPVGSFFKVTLPFPVEDLADFSGRFGCGCVAETSGPTALLPVNAAEGNTTFNVSLDASTIASSDQYTFSFFYRTSS
jgi:hypothetical protein